MALVLNNDVLGIILGQCSISSVINFSIACASHLKFLQKWHDANRIFLGKGYKLTNMQQAIYSEFKEHCGVMAVQAEMGFGKTILGLQCCDGFGIILVPRSVYKVWVGEANDLGWYHADPAKSKVLCYDSTRPRHKTYVESTVKDVTRIGTNTIILTTDSFINYAMEFMAHVLGNSSRAMALVVDEAHKGGKYFGTVQVYVNTPEIGGRPFERALLLSGSRMELSSPQERRVMGITIHRYLRVNSTLPKPELCWLIKEATPDNQLDVLRDIIRRNRKILMVCTEDSCSYFRDTNIFGKARLFILKKAVTTTRKFDEYDGKAVLVINTNQNEGLNVLADCVVVLQPSHMNVTRLIQTAGRIVRPTNKRASVKAYCICYTRLDVLRTHYTKAYSLRSWNWPYNILPDIIYLTKVVSFLAILGTNLEDVGQVDACIIFADYTSLDLTPKQVIDWWRCAIRDTDENTVLSRTIIKNLMSK